VNVADAAITFRRTKHAVDPDAAALVDRLVRAAGQGVAAKEMTEQVREL
jgi:hypothetical protein